MSWDALDDLFHQEVHLSVRDSIDGPLPQTEIPAGRSGCVCVLIGLAHVVLLSLWRMVPPASADDRVVGPALGLCLLLLTRVAVRTALLLLWLIAPPACPCR